MKISEEFKKSIVFLYSKKGQEYHIVATGFYISQQDATYLVTAKHVIEAIGSQGDDQTVHVRINLKDGGYVRQKFSMGLWKFSKDLTVDVAVARAGQPSTVHDIIPVPVSKAMTSTKVIQQSIDVGNEIFFAGLLTCHPGEKKNIPVVRTGTIAVMPEEPIRTPSGNLLVYLVDAHAIGGFSGSPVFVLSSQDNAFYLLGILTTALEISNLGTDKQLHSVNVGMSMVVPIERALEILQSEVTGKTSPELRSCLGAKVGLVVPEPVFVKQSV